jgi:hypothetical protein
MSKRAIELTKDLVINGEDRKKGEVVFLSEGLAGRLIMRGEAIKSAAFVPRDTPTGDNRAKISSIRVNKNSTPPKPRGQAAKGEGGGEGGGGDTGGGEGGGDTPKKAAKNAAKS